MLTHDDSESSSDAESLEESFKAIERKYGLCLVGLQDDLQKLMLSLVPTVDNFTFPSPSFLPDEIDKAAYVFLDQLHEFYASKKDRIKRLVIISHRFGGIFIKQALAIASKTQRYQELFFVISNLVFLSTPHRFRDGTYSCQSLIWDVIPANIIILGSWLSELVTHVDLISAKFRSIARRFDITNLLAADHASIDGQTNPWILGHTAEVNIGLEGPIEAGAIYRNMKDLTRLYNCLAPLSLLDSDTIFKVSTYICCLERLSWHSSQIPKDTLLNDAILTDTRINEKLILRLNLREVKRGECPPTVCLFGPSGCGKTSFLRNLCSGLDNYRDIIVIVFDKQDFQAINPSLVEILKSFLRQVLFHVPTIFSQMSHYFEFLRDQAVWTEQLLWSCMHHLLLVARGYKFVLFIDGICDWPLSFTDFLQRFNSLIQSNLFGLQIIYTSLVSQPILISDPDLNINVAEEAKRVEVTQLIKIAIDNQLASESVEKVIGDRLPTSPGDCLTTYLYLKQITSNSTMITPAILSRMLPGLPDTRKKIYKAKMESLESTNQDILQWSWGCLSWLAQSIRPLNISELSVAVALHQMGSDISKDEIKNNTPVKMQDNLDRYLGLLVCGDNDRVVLVHDTTKEFILSYHNSITEGGCGLASHADITIVCLGYLEAVLTTCINSTLEKDTDLALVRYCVEFWPRHYQLAVEDGQADQTTSLDNRVLASRLVSVNITKATGFDVACGLGQTRIVSHIMSERTRHEVDNEMLSRSLNAAVGNTQFDVVSILLHAGARSELALVFAAERNLVDMIDQLLEYEVTGFLGKAIIAAATYGSIQALRRLCGCCTDLGKLAQFQHIALDGAVTGGHTSVVFFILSQLHAGNINPKPDDPEYLPDARSSERAGGDGQTLATIYRSTLDIAVASGHTDIISLLFDAGAEVTNTSLEEASKQRNPKVVRLLTRALKSQNCILEHSLALHFASEKGSLSIVTEILDYGLDVNCRDDHDQTPLHKAAKNGHTDIVQLLLQRGADRNLYDHGKVMACHLAAGEGHLETYKALQEAPETRHDDMAVVHAGGGGHLLMVKYLLALKPNTVSTDDADTLNSALQKATSRGYLSIVHELCEAGVVINNRTGTTSPLHHAASGGYTEMVSYLITQGAEIDNYDEFERTPLHLSVGSFTVMELLLEKGANPDAADLNDQTPLHFSARLDQSNVAEECVKMLLCHKARVNVSNDDGDTPLLLAAGKAYSNVVDLLLKAGARPNIFNSGFETPLHRAVNSGSKREKDIETCVRILLNAGAKVNVEDGNDSTPIHWAASFGLMGSFKALLEKKPDLTILGRLSRTPFAEAVVANHLEVARILLEQGPDIDGRGRGKFTPLYLASHKGFTEMVRFLLDNGADHNITSINGWTPLGAAVDYGHKEVVELLLQRGAEVNHPTKGGVTPLHLAARKGFPEVLEILLQYGASVNATDSRGRTPLHRAADSGKSLKVVQLLLEHHADISIGDDDDETPLKAAERNGKFAIVEILEQESRKHNTYNE